MTSDIHPLIDHYIEEQQLPASFRALVDDYLAPLCRHVADVHRGKQHPLVLGVNGAQGSGKSTACLFLKLLFEALYDKHCAILSIDDFYLSRDERARLAAELHPLLRTRGVPGTHNVALAISVINALLNGNPVALPRFDKANDDCVPSEQWPLQQRAVDIILFEGWCVGARPQSDQQLAEPVNSLEREEDTEGHWRRYVNRCLMDDYQQLFAAIDVLVMFKVPDMASVFEWRSLQEQKLAQTADPNSTALMSAQQVQRFIEHYERLTRHMLMEMPDRADVVFSLSADHNIQSARGL